MVSTHTHEKPQQMPVSLGPLAGSLTSASLGLGGLGLVIALACAFLSHDANPWRRFMFAYVVAFAFVLSFSLGSLFFVLIQHLTRAGWSVLVRRFPEALAANLGWVAVLFLPIAATVMLGRGELYPWAVHHVDSAHHEVVTANEGGSHAEGSAVVSNDHAAAAGEEAHDVHAGGEKYHHQHLDELTLKKRAWLNPTAFIVRWVIFLGLWGAIACWLRRHSVAQDHDKDWHHTVRMETWAGPLTLIFGVTVTFAAWDLLMSLNPHWYSTMFGVYFFTGSVVATMSVLILMILGLRSRGVLPGVIGVEHQHDLGKLLFAFVFFWGYIAFSQYMLIWYANLPEETMWFSHRGAAERNEWTPLAIVLLFGHFLIPFVCLMSRHVKRCTGSLVFFAGWLVVMHAIDLWWIVMPELGPSFAIGWMEIGLVVGLSGIYFAPVFRRLASASLVPTADPRLPESIAFENI